MTYGLEMFRCWLAVVVALVVGRPLVPAVAFVLPAGPRRRVAAAPVTLGR